MALSRLFALPLMLACAAPALAYPGGPGWGGWGPGSIDADRWHRDDPGDSRPLGRVVVNRFVAEGPAADALGHGRIEAVAAPDDGPPLDPGQIATYEAAVIDQLAHLGYDTATADHTGGQVIELRVTSQIVVPDEAEHKPVSGAVTMGASNRGSMMGMELNVDMSKPRKGLVATHLDARIRDRASNAVLWEGRADMTTRRDDPKWGEQAIAGKLARALFDRFPGKSGETVTTK